MTLLLALTGDKQDCILANELQGYRILDGVAAGRGGWRCGGHLAVAAGGMARSGRHGWTAAGGRARGGVPGGGAPCLSNGPPLGSARCVLNCDGFGLVCRGIPCSRLVGRASPPTRESPRQRVKREKPHTLFWHSVKNVLGFVSFDGFQLILFYVPHTLLVVFVTVFPVEPFAAFLLPFFCLIVGILLL